MFNPSWVLPIGKHAAGVISAKVQGKDFLTTPSSDEENRDAINPGGSLGFFLFFKEDKGYLNVKYEFDYDITRGENWEYMGNKGVLNLLYPVTDSLRLTLSGEYYQQDYTNTHTIYLVKRKDRTVTLSPLITYEIGRFSIDLQYSYTKDDSNITVYEYGRNIYAVGVNYQW